MQALEWDLVARMRTWNGTWSHACGLGMGPGRTHADLEWDLVAHMRTWNGTWSHAGLGMGPGRTLAWKEGGEGSKQC